MSQLKELYPVKSKITHDDRLQAFRQNSQLIWFTGLSGSGKSTLAVHLEDLLFRKGYKTYLLDGDAIRTGLNHDLGFSEQDRIENIRRIAEVSKLMIDSGIVVLGAFISPLQVNRDMIKKIVGKENYFEVFVVTPLAICEQRDVKGLYKKARAGELKNFTGISSPYEKPENSDVVIKTDQMSEEESISLLLSKVEERIKL